MEGEISKPQIGVDRISRGVLKLKTQPPLQDWGFKSLEVFLSYFRVGQFEERQGGWLVHNCCAYVLELVGLLHQQGALPTGENSQGFCFKLPAFCFRSGGKGRIQLPSKFTIFITYSLLFSLSVCLPPTPSLSLVETKILLSYDTPRGFFCDVGSNIEVSKEWLFRGLKNSNWWPTSLH